MISEQEEQSFKNINKEPCVICNLNYCDCDVKKGVEWKLDREIIAERNKHLIGLKARFKNNEDYTKATWGKTGIITDSDLTRWLYLKYDEPLRSGYKNSMVSEMLILRAGSFELI